MVGEGSDSEGEIGVSDKRAVPEKCAAESNIERQELLHKSEHNMKVCVHVCVCGGVGCVCLSVCVSICVYVCVYFHCMLCVKKSWFLVGNHRSVAGNFDALTSTLRESRMRELELEE